MRNLFNIRIPDPSCSLSENILWRIKIDENEKIFSIDLMQKGLMIEGEDWQGDWISPRGVDLQINGGMGIDFTDLDFDKLPLLIQLLDRLWMDGVEAIAPTLVSCSVESLRRSLEVFRLVRQHNGSGGRCKLLGAHL